MEYNTKNNIIKFSFDDTDTDVGYYYNHINGQQFKNFLPAVNKLDILSRQSDNTVEINEGNLLYSYQTWNLLKTSLNKAAGKTYSDIAQLQFGYYSDRSNPATNLIESKTYKGNFRLTVNNIFDRNDYKKGNYYSMEIDLDNPEEGVTEYHNTSYTQDDANMNKLPKVAVDTISLNNVNFVKRTRVVIGVTTYFRSFKQSKLLLYEEGETVTQIAGIFGVERLNTQPGRKRH